MIREGFPAEDRRLGHAAPYWRYQDNLYESDGVIMYNDRVVVPPTLRQAVVTALNAAHQGVSTMALCARCTVYSLLARNVGWYQCCQSRMSGLYQERTIPTPATNWPVHSTLDCFWRNLCWLFWLCKSTLSRCWRQAVWMDWRVLMYTWLGTGWSRRSHLLSHQELLQSFWCPTWALYSDGSPEFTSSMTELFLHRWGVRHRVSSAYNPQSNGRAEVAVKSAKRLLRSHTGRGGTLNNDRFLRAMLKLRNTPDPNCNKSLAEIVFGRPLHTRYLCFCQSSHQIQQYKRTSNMAWGMATKGNRSPTAFSQVCRST